MELLMPILALIIIWALLMMEAVEWSRWVIYPMTAILTIASWFIIIWL